MKSSHNNKKGVGHGSSTRAPSQQAQSPEFKPQYHQKKKSYKSIRKKKLVLGSHSRSGISDAEVTFLKRTTECEFNVQIEKHYLCVRFIYPSHSDYRCSNSINPNVTKALKWPGMVAHAYK
jgi:hypothetical protein